MSDPLAKIGHMVVIFEENRSFDNFFGDFPGANGLANAGDKATQIEPDGKPYKVLPAESTPTSSRRESTSVSRRNCPTGRSRSTPTCRSMTTPAT